MVGGKKRQRKGGRGQGRGGIDGLKLGSLWQGRNGGKGTEMKGKGRVKKEGKVGRSNDQKD